MEHQTVTQHVTELETTPPVPEDGADTVINPDSPKEQPDQSVGVASSAVPKKPVQPVKSLTIDKVKVEVGYRCRYNALDCVIKYVWADDGGLVSLVKVKDGSSIGQPVPVGDLRFISPHEV